MSRSNTTWSPSKENLLLQNLKKLEQSTVSDESAAKTYGSQCSLNLENNFIDLPTEAKRRRIMPDESPSSVGSRVSSQMSSRSHSPTLSESCLDDSFMSTPSMMSTPSASPSGTLKEHFRRKYRKDELWASIETNYKYLMDKGIIEACQTTEMETEDIKDDSNISFGEFLKQYKELSEWLKGIQSSLQAKTASSLALSEKYLSQSYYDEIQRSPRLQLFDDCAQQLKVRQPILTDEVNVFQKEVHTQWDAVEMAVAPSNENQDPESMLRDLQDDLECLKKWLDGIEDHLKTQTSQDWPYEELDSVLSDHKVLQRDIESHSRVVSAVLKLSEKLNNDKHFLGYTLEQGSLEISAHNLERRWHGIWLQSLEWQCRLEDAISRKKGIFSTGPYLDSNYPNLREYTDDEYDTQDVNSSGDDSFNGLGFRRDFVQSPPKSDCSLSLSPDFDRSSGKDSALASETELKTNSDMSENYQDLSVSTGSESEREYLRNIKMRKRESRDIGYGSESQSDEIDTRYTGQGITFSGISGRVKKSPTKTGDFYATVVTESTESNSSKSDCANTNPLDPTTCDESDVGTQCQQVLLQEESEMEDIRYLIDQADIMVQQGNTFNKNFSPKHTPNTTSDLQTNADLKPDGSPKSLSSNSSSTGPSRDMIDKGVGTVESSCDASDEESGDSEGQVEECSMLTDDGTETIDSVMGSEYTSDEMKNCGRDNTRLPRLYDTHSLRARLKGQPRERPWSVIGLPNVTELQTLSASESAIDKLGGTHSDSDIPSASCSLSPSLPRQRVRCAQCLQKGCTRHVNTLRSQVGAKRKLSLDIPLSSERIPEQGLNDSTQVKSTVHIDIVNTPKIGAGKVANSEIIDSETFTSGNHPTIVPLGESCTSDEDPLTPMPCGNDLIHTLQSARFKSSGSSYDDSDTQGDPGVRSEVEDPNNDGSFSENAWDNYQAPLYATGSEDPPEEALAWDPGEMEFDDEFSIPQATILATLIARRSEEETYTSHPKLVPSNKGNFSDSDSDIEDLHHVLEESRIQLKVADRSLKKKRKDPLKTGLYTNPGKYGELLATIQTNIRCLEAINQHLDPADVSQKDIQTIQDLLYKWEKLHALASDRRNQSQEVKTMYATLLSIEGIVSEGVPQVEKTRFKSLEDLNTTIVDIQEKQKMLHCQQQILCDLGKSVSTFSAANPSVNMETFLSKIHDQQVKLEDNKHRCVSRLEELKHITCVWLEYKQTRQELEFLLTQERELIEKLAFSKGSEITGYKTNVEADIKKLVNSLSVYEEKLIALQRLRSELMEVSDDENQLDLTAGIADIRNQLFVAQKQCKEMMKTELETSLNANKCLKPGLEEELMRHCEEKMEVEVEPKIQKIETITMETRQRVKKPKSTAAPKKKMAPKDSSGWLKVFPISAIAFVVFVGLLYLFAPDVLYDMLGFSIRISPELKYVNGAPPM